MSDFVKACIIYLTGDTFTIVSNHKTAFGTYELGEPIIQGNINDSSSVIGEIILNALHSSTEGISLDKFISNPIVPKILKAVGFSSWSKFEKKKREYHVELSHGVATLMPYKRGEERGVTLPALSEPKKCKASSEEIGTAFLNIITDLGELEV